MISMKIKSISLSDFKGQKNESYEFGDSNSVVVAGRNGSGKTTIADSYYWAFIDKDYSLKSNPNIRPDDGRDCVPRVDICLEIDGKPVNIAKFQKKQVSESKGKTKISLTNRYEINGVVKTERDFKSDMEERGINFDVFTMLSNIDYYTSQKTEDMRKVLIGMTGDNLDSKIAASDHDLKELSDLLESYKLDEIQAMQKATKKKADEQAEALKNQIIGMEKAKFDESDIAEFELRKNALLEQISECESELSRISNGEEKEHLIQEINEKVSRKSDIETEENKKLSDARADIVGKIADLKSNKISEEYKLRSLELYLSHANMGIQRNTSDLQQARVNWRELNDSEYNSSVLDSIKSEQFDEENLICPTCGQLFSNERADRIRQDFEESKKKRIEKELKVAKEWESRKEEKLKTIEQIGKTASENLKESKVAKESYENEIQECKDSISKLTIDISNAEMELKKIPVNADFSGNEEYNSLSYDITELKAKLEELNSKNESDMKPISQKISDLKKELLDVQKELSKSDANVKIDDNIEEAEKMRTTYVQAGADAKKILDQIESLKMKKNIALEKTVNSYFDGVKVKLFAMQKNGDAVDACEWKVFDEQYSRWTNLSGCANTALAIRGKARIISGLQKFYGISFPVFIDYAAELDSENVKAMNFENQMIYLKVADENLTIKGV